MRLSELGPPSASLRDGVHIELERGGANAAFEALRDGDPSIWVRAAAGRDDVIDVSVGFLDDGEAEVVARRLREVLGA
jgi:hypothetical protein